MNSEIIRFSGPYTHENLCVFLIHGTDTLTADPYLTLEEALNGKTVVVHETGNVSELEIENLGADKDVFVQAGDIVRGGRQDRTFGCDYIVPARSGRVPVPSFCVEACRWHKRADEADHAFSSSTHYLSSKDLKLWAKFGRSQRDVWAEVAKSQAKLGKSVHASVHDAQSHSSYELTLEHEKVRARRDEYVKALTAALDGKSDVLGFAFAINGRLNSAEVYGSNALFRKLWKKLIESAAVEALAELGDPGGNRPVTEQDAWAFLENVPEVPAAVNRVSERVVVLTRRGPETVSFETRDEEVSSQWVHRNYISETK